MNFCIPGSSRKTSTTTPTQEPNQNNERSKTSTRSPTPTPSYNENIDIDFRKIGGTMPQSYNIFEPSFITFKLQTSHSLTQSFLSFLNKSSHLTIVTLGLFHQSTPPIRPKI